MRVATRPCSAYDSLLIAYLRSLSSEVLGKRATVPSQLLHALHGVLSAAALQRFLEHIRVMAFGDATTGRIDVELLRAALWASIFWVLILSVLQELPLVFAV